MLGAGQGPCDWPEFRAKQYDHLYNPNLPLFPVEGHWHLWARGPLRKHLCTAFRNRLLLHFLSNGGTSQDPPVLWHGSCAYLPIYRVLHSSRDRGGFGWCQLEARTATESMALWRRQGEGLPPSPFLALGLISPYC